MIRVVAGPGRRGPLRLIADGAVVNPGLPDEAMPAALLAFAQSLADLRAGKGAQATLLFRADLVWVMRLEGDEVLLRWVRVGKPASAVVRQARLDAGELAEAVAEALGTGAKRAKLKRALTAKRATPARADDAPGFRLVEGAGPITLHLEVDAVPDAHGSPWDALLAPGKVELRAGDERLAWSGEPPYLVLVDLLRFATRAASVGRREPLPLPHGGELSVHGNELRIGRHHRPDARLPFAAGVSELALRFLSTMGRARPALAGFEPLTEQAQRAAQLASLVQTRALAPARDAPRPKPPKRARRATPLSSGSVRKVTFEPLFETRLPFGISSLALVGERVVARGEEAVAVLELDGHLGWARKARAVHAGGVVLGVDDADRFWRFDLETGDPRWFRDSEGIQPRSLHPLGRGVVALEEADAISGRYTETGLGAWHFRLPMGDRLGATYAPDRIYVATGSGQLASLDAETGLPHFRAMAPRPFRHAPLREGSGLLALLQGDEGDELLHLDATNAQVRWSGKLGLRDAGPLVAFGGIAATVGRSGEGWALALVRAASGEGQLTATPFDGRHAPALVATEEGLLVAGDDGRAVLFHPEGPKVIQDDPSEPTLRPIAPILERGLALLGSERPAFYDLAACRQVAQLPRLEGLTAMAADNQLRVVVGDDAGTLRGYRLRGHLAVLPDPPPVDPAP